MHPSDNKTPPDEKKQDPIVIPDECGDSLWDEVLAQYPDLSTIVSKPADQQPPNKEQP